MLRVVSRRFREGVTRRSVSPNLFVSLYSVDDFIVPIEPSERTA